MTEDDEHDRANLRVVAELVRDRQLSGRPIPDWLKRHLARCESRALSRSRHEEAQIGSPSSQLEASELIDAREAARMLRCSVRTVQRMAAELGGRRVGGRLVFDRSAILEHMAVRGA